MKFGINTFLWTASFDESHLPLLPRLKAAGFDGVELPILEPAFFPAPAIRRALEANALECTVCSVLPPGFSMISGDPEARARYHAYLTALIRKAAETGASILAGPLYSPVGYLPGRRRTTEEWKWAIDGFQALVPVLNEYRITIAIEPLNRFETFFLNTAADAVALCDAIAGPRVGILFDTFHANIEEKDVARAFRAAGPHLKHVHTSENDRGTPGTGHVDWRGVIDSLTAVSYDGWLTIESFGFSLGAISTAASIWRDIESHPEAIAFEGIAFLRYLTLGSGSESIPITKGLQVSS